MNTDDVLVLDEKWHFRKLNTENYDDDIIVGTVLFDRESIYVIKKYFLIVGYVLIGKNTKDIYPIDIRDKDIALFEGTYNCFPEDLKNEIAKYNIHKISDKIWSNFFIQWQFLLDKNCFEENGPMIELSSKCLSKCEIIDLLMENDCNIFDPVNYEELKIVTQKLFNIFHIDINLMDYELSFKYLVDSVVNGYYIRFEKRDIDSFFFNVCTFCIEKIKGEI